MAGMTKIGKRLSQQMSRSCNGLARLTPALPDRDRTGPVPANFSSVLQSSFLAHACSMPACLHQNFEGNLKEHQSKTEKRLEAGEKQVKMWVV